MIKEFITSYESATIGIRDNTSLLHEMFISCLRTINYCNSINNCELWKNCRKLIIIDVIV